MKQDKDKKGQQKQEKKFDTASLDSMEIDRILREEHEREEQRKNEAALFEQSPVSGYNEISEKHPRNNSVYLKKWHKICLLIAFSILALSVAAYAFARTYIKPPDRGGVGIEPGITETDNPSTQEPVVSAQPSEPVETDPPIEGDPPKINKNVYNIILAGFDDIDGSVHTDTLMVLSYNAEKRTINIVSVPRDTCCNVGWTSTKKINSAYAIGGMGVLSRELKKVMGFECDYYVLIEMDAMEELVETIGGVEFDVPTRMHYRDPVQSLLIDLYPGQQTLSGEQAVQLCRWRQNNDGFKGGLNGDLGRIELQHDFMMALAKQCMSVKNIVTNIGSYAEIFSENVTSNLTTGEMIWFGLQFIDVGADNINTFTLDGYPGMLGDTSYYFLYPKKIAAMMNDYFNPYDDHTITAGDLNIYIPSKNSGSTSTPEPGTSPPDPGTDPTDPGAEPGTDPTEPGMDPTDPGTQPYEPGIPIETPDGSGGDGDFFETPG